MKIQRVVTLDIELWQEAKERHLNISELCNNGLKEASLKNKYKDMSLPELERKLALVQKRNALEKELAELPNE